MNGDNKMNYKKSQENMDKPDDEYNKRWRYSK